MRKQSSRLPLQTGDFGEVWKMCGYTKEKAKPVVQRGWKILQGPPGWLAARWDAAGCSRMQGRTMPRAVAHWASGAGTCWTQGSRQAAAESHADACSSSCTGLIWVLPRSIWNISCACKWQFLISTQSFRWHFQRCY